jgi:uncharacterized OB-fold protein
VPSAADRPFWDAARQHRLVLPRCADCGHTWFPPYPACPRCRSRAIGWEEASGRGTVFGAAVFERPYLRAFPVPYHVALVELDEGPKLYGNVVDVADTDVVAGMRVEVVFDDVSDTITLPRFRRATPD